MRTAPLTLRANARRGDWSTHSDIVSVLAKAWDAGRLLRAHAASPQWLPLTVLLRSPDSAQLTAHLTRVREWAQDLTAAANGGRRSRGPRYALQHKSIGGRDVGSNQVPARAVFETEEQVWDLLGVAADVATFDQLRHQAAELDQRIAEWVVTHPRKALDVAQSWSALLRAVTWISENAEHQLYLRQIDAVGVDTKLLESNHQLVATLLDLVLPEQRINGLAPRRDLASRYGFRTRPVFIRSRMLDGTRWISEHLGDCYLQIEDLAALRPPVDRVIIVENEISYLALPELPRTLAMFGKGYDVNRFALLDWLTELPVTYWGDLDTHGFAIVDRLRRHVPHAQTLLMDSATLLVHRHLWGRETTRAPGVPTRLTGPEFEAYDLLLSEVDDAGHPVRLEQERLPFDLVRAALSESADM